MIAILLTVLKFVIFKTSIFELLFDGLLWLGSLVFTKSRRDAMLDKLRSIDLSMTTRSAPKLASKDGIEPWSGARPYLQALYANAQTLSDQQSAATARPF